MRIVSLGYEKYGETVYYSSSKMEKVDILTFEILDTLYARDKNNVYYEGKKIENLKPSDFIYLGDFYVKYKNVVIFKCYFEC